MIDTNLTRDVRRLIDEFKIPNHDEIIECMLALPESVLKWNAGVFIAKNEGESLYADIFHFWVRSFFSFSENTWEGKLLWDTAPFVACEAITPDEFQKEYIELVQSHVPDDFFIDTQSSPQMRVELLEMKFTDCYRILNRPDIKSAVSKSGSMFISFVIRGKA